MLCGTAGAERMRKDGVVKEVPAESVDFASRDGWAEIPDVYFRTQEGDVITLDDDQVDYGERQGWWRMTADEVAAYHDRATRDRMSQVADDARTRYETNDAREKSRATWMVIVIGGAAIIAVLIARHARKHPS